MTAIWTLLNVAIVIPITQDFAAVEPIRTALRRDPNSLKRTLETAQKWSTGGQEQLIMAQCPCAAPTGDPPAPRSGEIATVYQ
ncbi:MAG TPA: hypothetical protein VJR30_11700 [Bradyrhizobium sp.]|nr:hypothetical protein [Bradyrhizobium sp.]